MLKTISGIGDIVALELLILLPELSALSRRQIAALTGAAPKANDSGCFNGYRRTGHGRKQSEPTFFIAAMAAINSHSSLKSFYEKLTARDKKKNGRSCRSDA